MRYKTSAIMSALFSILACRGHQEVKAKIFERKEVSENRLIIKYQYTLAGKTYIDSAAVKNIVIGNDSINLIIDPADPQRSLPDFSK